MRYGKGMAYCLTAVFLAAAVLIGAMDDLPEAETVEIPLSVSISSEAGTETIFCWQQEAGKYYVFLPSYAAGSQMRFRTDGSREIYIEGSPVEDNMLLSGFQMNTPYDIQISGDAFPSGTIEFVCSANVPTMYLDTHSGNMDYIHAEKGNAEPGRFRLYSPQGILEHSGTLQSINGRGNTTWYRSKKSYSITLSAQADLAQLGAAHNWVLLSNSFDASHLRNKAVYDFAERIGLPYSPDSTWVDLYLNGEYTGLYLLSERNEIHPERVDVPQSGSVLVSMDMEERMVEQERPYILLDADTSLRLHSGEKVTDELTAVFRNLDNAIQAENGIDPATGKHYSELLDTDSWERKFLLEEVFGNVDSSSISQYFFVDGNDDSGKVYAGPVWDYDFALGSSATWQTETVAAFFSARPYIWSETDTPWFYGLWQKDNFRQAVISRYEREFRPQLLQLLESDLEQYAGSISQASRMNQLRWNTKAPEEETQKIRNYLQARIDFLDDLWLEGEAYYTVTANRTDTSTVACYVVRPGEQIPQLPMESGETDAIGWYDYDTGEPFDNSEPIDRNRRIYIKREEPPQRGASSLTIHYLPVAGLLLILLTACLLDSSRRKRTDIQKNERTKTSKISS